MRWESALLSLTTTATFSADCPWTTGAAARQTARVSTAPTTPRRITKASAGLLMSGPKDYSGQDGQDGQDGRDGQDGQDGRDGRIGRRGSKGRRAGKGR